MPNDQGIKTDIIDDLISRQAAILALVHEQSWNLHEDQRTAIGVIADLPPADAQRRGRWDNGFCSVCGEEALTEWNDTGGEYAFTTFCPNCGAKMNSSTVKGE